ncbi:DUF305 domain-containing protein [Dyadobacter psychrotolerans]|jgi:uncharacterized protein (DUF305 family)|uniref:DUF305 domain-containing protein n=1 Tax=Dyadobacter psychrotolerans TaxID=2541721 RepID=A0A4R5DBL1_9BACT|nr:DUF305 domain-containing protein [Dyadobacter psychrotolerans]TDE09380.1 DUF305 domain-containing protein [Dyadobacter psychrotolerans]
MKTLKIFALLAALSIYSCKDDAEGIIVQDHDTNAFMTIMHSMNAQMDAMKMTGDADHDFASMMVMHHQGAIDMANKEIEIGNDANIKAMAQQIIDKQTAEKTDLTEWLKSHTPQSNAEGQAFDAEMIEVMAKMKNWKDIQVLTGDADADFSELMIVHHQTATDNASSILHHGHHADIKEMASMMIKDQNKEITDLAAWLKENGPSNQ